MLIQKLQCPNGCQNATISESIKAVKGQSNNLLLEGEQGEVKKIKVCTCSCCNTSFEIPIQGQQGMLFS